MNNDDNITFLINLVNVLSFAIGLQNLDMNDKQVNALDDHLSKQDEQYEKIINLLEEIKSLRRENNNER